MISCFPSVSSFARRIAASCNRRSCCSIDSTFLPLGIAVDGYPWAANPPIKVASICFNDGIHSANRLRYSNSDATGLYSKYTVSNFWLGASLNGSTPSNESTRLPDIHNSSRPSKWANIDVLVRRFRHMSTTFKLGKDNCKPVGMKAPSSSIALWERYNSSNVACCDVKFSILVNRLDCTSSRRNLVNCNVNVVSKTWWAVVVPVDTTRCC